ncbi:MAG: aminotransferase class I/II-fold pyridoxal phosphate-dependent enzyme [Elusimicrobia bacterium]|nr:aminotransferase class I/II-fold pyridoxal phosphate-dependent enzyme [Elusimicrobiota bacterium]
MTSPPLGAKIGKFPPYLFRELDRKKENALKLGEKVISLAVGDPDMPTPRPIVRYAGREIFNPANHKYPPNTGSRKLKEAIAEWHKKRHGIKIDPETQVLALIGSKEGLAHLPFVLVNRGDVVLTPDPCYPAYKTGVILSDAVVKSIPLREGTGFLPELEKIPGRVLSRTKLMFLNYPNNPTGALADMDFYAKAVRLAKKHSFWIAQDAAYSEIYFDRPARSILEIPGAVDVAVEFYSVSKTFNMTGWRLAWLIGNSRVIQALSRLKEHIDSGPFNAIQEAAVYALENIEKFAPAIRREYKKRKEFFAEKLASAGWKVFEPGGTFFVWARPPAMMSSMECADKVFERTFVLVSPGSGFGRHGEGYVRFSMTADMPVLAEAASRISRISW